MPSWLFPEQWTANMAYVFLISLTTCSFSHALTNDSTKDQGGQLPGNLGPRMGPELHQLPLLFA